MSEIIIYTKEMCPHCLSAKTLLKNKGATFNEIKIVDDATKEEMIKKSNGRKTVPQIFIGDYHVGGCDNLYALDFIGKLDSLLKK